ncbi:17894_t:CDS:2 [Gigaspora margarita]|uniref:17894_t:CDS:1 n=1 Tax=Gigaspora margarita TaxID=4874 RepID=A0ABN7W3C2_GIGMA|nr:17894_t:CDS:2 [Gigaspora margarita]
MIPNDVQLPLTLDSRIETLDISPIEVMYCEATLEQHSIYLKLDTRSSKYVKVTETKDYAIIVGTDWLRKVKRKIDLAKRVFKKPVSLKKKYEVDLEEINEEENEKEYDSEEVEEKRSYVVQGDEDEVSIVEIKKNSVSIEGKKKNLEPYKRIKQEILEEKGPDMIGWYKKRLNNKADSCAICQDLSTGIETLECLVENLNKELEYKRY